MSHQLRVYLVDPDLPARRSVVSQLSAVGAEAWPFSSSGELLEIVDHLAPACLLIDMDEASCGLWLMEELIRRGVDWPVVAISGEENLQLAVEAMKLGAVDFLRKPATVQTLTSALAPAWSALQRKVEAAESRRAAQERISRLTRREFDILLSLIAGHPNKAAAFEFGISVRTIEMHRANIMAKLGVKSLAEATLLATQAGVQLLSPGMPRLVGESDHRHYADQRFGSVAAYGRRAAP